MSNLYNDADYIELIIKALFRDKHSLQKALDLRLEPSDFGTINVYRLFVDCALSIGDAPISSKLCLAKSKDLFEKHSITDSQKSTVLQFWEYIYTDEEINSDYITKNLADFLKFRRYQTLKVDKINDPEELINQATKLVSDIQLKDSTEGVVEFNPFEQLVLVEHKDSLMTGFSAVDAVARGLNYQEFGMILGHSGSGKTAMAVYSAIQNAKAGKKVLYLSLEEPAQNICSRLYSNMFRINYTDLHKGSVIVQQDLRDAFAAMNCRDKGLMQNLKIHDLRNITPVSAKYIENYLDKLYNTTGYHPDLVYIDQLDYLTATGHFDAEWQKYSKAAFEVDELCDHLIGGQHPFSVWLLHQATGKMTRRFSNAEISGFKGIIKPTDMCLAIGRDSSQDQIVSIFSLKSRHAKNFQFDYIAELEYMNFELADRAATDRVQQDASDKKDRRSTVKTNYNVPRVSMLPSATTGFNSSV
jgi:replicative DNA helicase